MLVQQYFELRTCGAPIGHPKLELLSSNGAHFCHAIYHHSKVMLKWHDSRVPPGCTTRGRHGCIRVYKHKPRLLCLNIHTHLKVSNSLGKCKRCLNALHRYTCPAASQLHALYLIVLNQLASYSIALPSLIESTWTDSCCLKSKISHEKIALKIPAEAIVFVILVEPMQERSLLLFCLSNIWQSYQVSRLQMSSN